MLRIAKILCICLLAGSAAAQTIKVGLGEKIPPDVIDKDHGLIVDLLQEMNKLPGGARFNILGTFPFQRSIKYVIDGMADLHLPLLKDPAIPVDSLDYAYSTGTFTHVPFGLYVGKTNTRITPANIKDFKVCIQPAHLQYFKGGTAEMPIEAGLARVESGEIDGFICALITGDEIVKRRGYSRVTRQLMAVFESKAVIPKGERGKAIDLAFTTALERLRQDGTLDKVYPEVKFEAW